MEKRDLLEGFFTKVKGEKLQLQRGRHYASMKYCLEQCYAKFSEAKRFSYEYWLDMCTALEGWSFRINAYNTMCYSLSFFFNDHEGNICFAYITRDNARYCICRKAGSNNA